MRRPALEYVLGLCLIVLYFCRLSYPSQACRDYVPIPINTFDLEGQWYWVATQMDSPGQEINDCTGFRFKKYNDTTGVIVVTDSKHISSNVKLMAFVRDSRIVVPHTETNCMVYPRSFANYTVSVKNINLVLQDSYLCFYTCGPAQTQDYVSCFSRYTVMPDDEYNIYKAFHTDKGFKLNRFKRITRENCAI